MTKTITGLDALKAMMNEATQEQSGGDFEKIERLTVKDGESRRFVVLSELDETSPGYSAKRGLAVIIPIHKGQMRATKAGKQFLPTAVCNRPDEKCWACEQYENGDKQYKPKRTLYFNALVLDDDGKPDHVAVHGSTVWARDVVSNMLMETAIEQGTISDITWKMSARGTGTAKAITLMPGRQHSFDLDAYEVYDLEAQAAPHIPYEKQAGFYLGYQATADDDEGFI